MSYSQRAKNAPTAKVTSKSAQKSEQPAHTKPFKFESEKGRVEKQEDDWRPGKRMNITAQDTGRIQNKTIVSTESPDWMKSFFENNRAYFEKQGVAQKLKKQGPPGESPAGVPSSAREKGKKPGTQMTCDETGILFSQTVGSANSPDWMDNPWKPPAAAHTPRRVGQRAGIDRHTANPTPRAKSANEMQHLLVSDSVPPWMKSSTVVEAMAKGCGSARRTGEQDDSRAAGVTTERFWDESSRNKGGNMIHPATGRVLHKAHQSDDFPLDSGRNHRAAFEETMRQRPQSARAQGPHYAGDRSKEFRDKAKGAVVDQLTGKVANSSIVSPESPQWMKEPFENNRQYFQNKGVAQKLRALSAEELRDTGFIAGRPVPVRARQVHKQITNEAGRVQNMSIVSRTAPDWMKSPFESNRTYFENAGIAQSKEFASFQICSTLQDPGGFTGTAGGTAAAGGRVSWRLRRLRCHRCLGKGQGDGRQTGQGRSMPRGAAERAAPQECFRSFQHVSEEQQCGECHVLCTSSEVTDSIPELCEWTARLRQALSSNRCV